MPYQRFIEEYSHLATLAGFKELHEDKWNAPFLHAFFPNLFWQYLSCINHTSLIAFGWVYHINSGTETRPEVWGKALSSFKDAEASSQHINPQRAAGCVHATVLLVLELGICRVVNILLGTVSMDGVATVLLATIEWRSYAYRGFIPPQLEWPFASMFLLQ